MKATQAITVTRVVELVNKAKLKGGNEEFLTLLYTEPADASYFRNLFRFAGLHEVEAEDGGSPRRRTVRLSGKQQAYLLEACFVHCGADIEPLLDFFEKNVHWRGPGISYAESYMFAPTLIALLGAHDWGHAHHEDTWAQFHELMPELIATWIKSAVLSTEMSENQSELGMNDWARGELTNRLRKYFGTKHLHLDDAERESRLRILSSVSDAYRAASVRFGMCNGPSAPALEVLLQLLSALFLSLGLDEQFDALLGLLSPSDASAASAPEAAEAD